jgi:hypothetical protein
MSVTPKTLIDAKQAENALTTQYTATNVTALIDKFTVTNTTGGAQTIDVHLVPEGGSADATNKVIDAATVAANATMTLTQLSGQVLEAGDFISTIASAATALTIRCSGREVS